MSRAEFCDWFDRFDRAPFDDRHRYHRPAAWLAMSINGVQPRDSLPWLTNGTMQAEDAPAAAPEGVPAGEWSQADLNTFAAFGMGRKKG